MEDNYTLTPATKLLITLYWAGRQGSFLKCQIRGPLLGGIFSSPSIQIKSPIINCTHGTGPEQIQYYLTIFVVLITEEISRRKSKRF